MCSEWVIVILMISFIFLNGFSASSSIAMEIFMIAVTFIIHNYEYCSSCFFLLVFVLFLSLFLLSFPFISLWYNHYYYHLIGNSLLLIVSSLSQRNHSIQLTDNCQMYFHYLCLCQRMIVTLSKNCFNANSNYGHHLTADDSVCVAYFAEEIQEVSESFVESIQS